MAILAVDEVMLREPRLLVPQAGPVGLVKLDRTHPIAQRMVFAAVAGQNADLVSGQPLSGVIPAVKPYQGVKCWEFNGTKYLQMPLSVTLPYTLFAVASCTNTDNNTKTMLSLGAAAGGAWLDFAPSLTNDPVRVLAQAASGSFGQTKASPSYKVLLPVWGDLFGTTGSVYQWRRDLTASTDSTGTVPTVTEVSIGSMLFSGSRINYMVGYIAFACVIKAEAGLGAILADDWAQVLIPA